jgi:hypothetical protein
MRIPTTQEYTILSKLIMPKCSFSFMKILFRTRDLWTIALLASGFKK